ncbi:hypothetical protein FRC02_003583 [Tulasnella sp. 418]|nr:hypothetical protein FRC02_003583 [Tulasnella sp. 418]
MAARKLLIQNGTIVTCSSTLEPYEPTVFRGDLFVVGGVISKIDKKINISDTSDIEVIDATDQLVIPGFVDAHRHVWEGAYKWAGDWSLWE